MKVEQILAIIKKYKFGITIPTLLAIVTVAWMINDSIRNNQIELKNTQIELDKQKIEQLTQKNDSLSKCSIDNFYSLLSNRTKFYTENIDDLNSKILQLEAQGIYDSEQIKWYRKKISEYQTKINIIGDLSTELKKEIESTFGRELSLSEVVPFIYYKLPNENNPSEDSIFRSTFTYYLLKCPPEVYFKWLKQNDSIGNFVLNFFKGSHSPYFYMFDNVDLRTASFNNTDFRGVDLSTIKVDSKTKFPRSLSDSKH